jgi:hypothetical protein
MPVVYTRSHQQAAGMEYAGIEGGVDKAQENIPDKC